MGVLAQDLLSALQACSTEAIIRLCIYGDHSLALGEDRDVELK